MDLSTNLDRLMFEVEFKTYLDYIEFMEQFLDTEQKKEEEFIHEFLSKHEAVDIAWLSASGNSPGKIAEFSGFLRNSFFVSLYAYFENKLIRECRLRKTNFILLDFDDIRGFDVIERVKKYFTKVLRTNFPSNTLEWETIQDYRIIRNCIVHAQGKLEELKDKKDREKLQRFVSKNKNISLFRNEEDPIHFFKNNGEIYIDKGFCEEACKTIETFLIMVLFPDKTE